MKNTHKYRWINYFGTSVSNSANINYTPITGRRHLRNAVLASAAVLVIACLLFVGWLFAGYRVPRSEATPVPWIDQLTIAQQAALKVDKDAVLSHVVAQPLDSQTNFGDYSDGTLQYRVIFEFASPPSSKITVQFYETEPTSTLKITRDIVPGYGGLLTPQLLQEYSSRSEQLKVSPREAVLTTSLDAQKHMQHESGSISVIVGLDLSNKRTNPQWLVDYENQTAQLSTLTYSVDTVTGEVTQGAHTTP
jgi:hypothetical protein